MFTIISMNAKANKHRISTTPTIENKKARFNYEFLEKYEAGLALLGSEVKSLREGKASIAEAFVRINNNNEAYLIKAFIAPYEQAGRNNHDPNRPRKLLLHKREINRLMGRVNEKGLTIVPVKIYFNERGLAKIQIALARGKANYDKREKIRKRDIERQTARDMRKYK